MPTPHTNTPNLRFPEFKEDWETKKLGEVTEYVKGFAFKSEFYANEGIRIVRVSDLSARSIKHDNDKIFINLNRTKELEKYRIKKGDIIITTVGSKPELLDSAVGRGIFVKNSDEGLLNQNLLKLNKSEEIDNGFLFGYINSEKYISHIKEIQRGNANQSNITVVDLLNYKIHHPSLLEQQKIATFLTAVDEKLSALKQKKNLLEQYKKGVMQQLFSQELRFKDDNGNDFAEWEARKLGELTFKVDKKNKENIKYPVYSINNKEGFLPQSDQFEGMDSNDRGYDISIYKVIESNTFAYNPARINVGSIGFSGELSKIIISSLYVCFKTIDSLEDGYLLHYLGSAEKHY